MQEEDVPHSKTVTWAEATRDIVIAAMDKGQLPFLALGAIVFLLIIRLPSNHLVIFLRTLGERLQEGEYISYPLLIGCILGWFLHVRHMKRKFTREYERIGKEKTYLQKQLTGLDLKSSDD